MKVDPRHLDGLKPFKPSDLFILFGLSALALVAWLTPERRWPALARRMAAISGRAKGAFLEDRVRRIRHATAGRNLDMVPKDVAQGLIANDMVRQLQIMRSHMPGGWYPEIEVTGVSHLEAAIDKGKGVVLGASYFCWVDEISTMGAHQIGHPVSILTQVTHGYSSTRFGVRYLNPLRCALDEKYARERIPLFLDQPIAAMRTILALLKKGRLVAFGFRENAVNPIRVPFLGSILELGSGPVDIAYKSGAPMLSTHLIRTEPGKFRLIYDPEIEIRRDLPRLEAARLALEEYVRRLEPLVLAYPDQWNGWRVLPDD